MILIYFDHNAVSRISSEEEFSNILDIFPTRRQTEAVASFLSPSHIRETIRIPEGQKREAIIQAYQSLTDSVRLEWKNANECETTKVDLRLKCSEPPSPITKATYGILKSLKSHLKIMMASCKLESKRLNNLTASEALSEIENAIRSAASKDSGNPATVELAVQAFEGIARDLSSNMFPAEFYESLKEHAKNSFSSASSGSESISIADIIDHLQTVFQTYSIGYLTVEAAKFMILSAGGYFPDEKEIETEDHWHFQYGTLADITVSDDARFRKRATAIVTESDKIQTQFLSVSEFNEFLGTL